MDTILDLSAVAVAGGVLAYQLICLQAEQRELREAINERLSELGDSLSIPSAEIATSVAGVVINRLERYAPAAQDQMDAGPVPAPATPATPATPAAEAPGELPAPPSEESKSELPGGLTKAQARKQLMAELDAMTTDKIRARVRQLSSDQRIKFNNNFTGRSLDKARKDQLIAGLLKTFDL